MAGHDALHREIAALREQLDAVSAELHAIKANLRGHTRAVQDVLDVTRTEAAMIAVLMTGRRYTAEQLAGLVCRENTGPNSIFTMMCRVRKRYPWLIEGRARGGRLGTPYALTPRTIARLKAMIDRRSPAGLPPAPLAS